MILLRNFNDFDNGMEFFRKTRSGKMKVEDAKELQNILKSGSKGNIKRMT